MSRTRESLAEFAPWFATEVAAGRGPAVLTVVDSILLQDGADEGLMQWARRVRALIVSARRGRGSG